MKLQAAVTLKSQVALLQQRLEFVEYCETMARSQKSVDNLEQKDKRVKLLRGAFLTVGTREMKKVSRFVVSLQISFFPHLIDSDDGHSFSLRPQPMDPLYFCVLQDCKIIN